MYRAPRPAPLSRVEEGRRGEVVGRWCSSCGGVFPLQRGVHRGKALNGRDHVASPCTHEGQSFAAAADWWEPAVEVLPAPEEPAPEEPPADPGG